ncbi:MAG: D-2-hydroxyacid dehydrogenase [Microscillaceae bacterium]
MPPSKIVYLDGYTVNPGDLDWGPLKALGQVFLYDRSHESEVMARCAGAEILLTNKVPFDADRLAQLPDLRYIGVTATGYNIIDVEAARAQNIVVSNIPDYGTDSVAQHTWALILELSNRVGAHDRSVKAGEWSRNPDWCYWQSPLTGLAGKNLGILGMGKIGQAVARIGQAFQMQVLFHSRIPKDFEGAKWCTWEALLENSDILSLHVPLLSETEHIIRAESLARMRPQAWLINTSRGGLIQEADLKKALVTGQIAGAALDVLSQEPPPPSHPLLGLSQVVLTPHNAWASQTARQRLLDIAVENIRSFLKGAPQNQV